MSYIFHVSYGIKISIKIYNLPAVHIYLIILVEYSMGMEAS